MGMEEILRSCQLNPGASEEATLDAASSLKCSLPSDYVDFLLAHNGGEGFIGGHYLILWQVQELKSFNSEYEVDTYAPGLLLFASSGGGTGYGFDTRQPTMPVVAVEFVGMNWDEADSVAGTFTEFLNQLAK